MRTQNILRLESAFTHTFILVAEAAMQAAAHTPEETDGKKFQNVTSRSDYVHMSLFSHLELEGSV